MNGRKLAAFALSGVMAVGLTACGGNTNADTNTDASNDTLPI